MLSSIDTSIDAPTPVTCRRYRAARIDEKACGDVGDREPHLARLVGRPGECDRSALGLNCKIVGLVVGSWPAEAVPGNVAGDEVRRTFAQLVSEHTGAFGGCGREILHKNVGAGHQLFKGGAVGRDLQVQLDALFAPVRPYEEGRRASHGGVVPAGEVTFARTLDLEHRRAEVGELPGRKRGGDRLLEGDDDHSVEGRAHQGVSTRRPLTSPTRNRSWATWAWASGITSTG